MVVSPSSLPVGHLGQLPQPLYHLQDTPTETRSFSQLSQVGLEQQSHATAQLQAGALPSSGQIQAGSLGSIHGAGIQLQPAPSGFRSQELSRNHILYLETSMNEGMTSADASRSPGSMGRAANVRTVAAGMGASSSDGGSLASLRKRSYEARSPESPLQGLISVPRQGGEAGIDEEHVPLVKGGGGIDEEDVPLVKGGGGIDEEDVPLVKGEAGIDEVDVPLVKGEGGIDEEDVPLVKGEGGI
ncbi:hypothetical protein Pmani_015106 [Petrolisthes manimaculis]|uniref:Uncharacterized protein n=1 Tax=Petrolisthes manimaculis TaxID=1843537 RepID=A0AAE1PSA2_9EUCA|nr:hypothetical protein Pmani_015106 [Petrolisthes manimaculis]